MIKFDFWDCGSVLTGLSELYGLDENSILRMNIESLCEDNPIASFVKKANIKLDAVDVSQVMLHCKHIMTIDDEFESIKKYGLLPLNKVLAYDTPLHNFLFEHGIDIDVDNRKLFYKGNEVDLYKYDEECKSCFYGGECKKSLWFNGEPTTLTYKNMACDFRKGISVLETKLYTDKSEIEVHLSGKLDDVHGYSCVKYNPEILTTIEQMICKLFKESPHLESDWRKRQAGEYYCLDFDVNIGDFEAITTRPIFENYEDYFEFNKEPMHELYNVSSNFYGNVFILERALPILLGDSPTVYGQLLPSIKISYNDIKVTKFKVDHF